MMAVVGDHDAKMLRTSLPEMQEETWQDVEPFAKTVAAGFEQSNFKLEKVAHLNN